MSIKISQTEVVMYKAFLFLITILHIINPLTAAESHPIEEPSITSIQASVTKIKFDTAYRGTLTLKHPNESTQTITDIARMSRPTLYGALYTLEDGSLLHIINPKITVERLVDARTLKVLKLTGLSSETYVVFLNQEEDDPSLFGFTNEDDQTYTEFRTTEEIDVESAFSLCSRVIDLGQWETRGFRIQHSSSASNTFDYFTTPCGAIVRVEDLRQYERMTGESA